ncbi:MAG: hypothetical protein GY874_07075 [Desulfobacteraceae bacterium]|nr:hypothetical protein [Desulfobacteraceae bacterium]
MKTRDLPEPGPSLLPYLKVSGSTGFFLHLLHEDCESDLQAVPSIADQSVADQSVADQAGVNNPFVKLIRAQVAAGSRQGLVDLFLLVQPDNYPVSATELNPLNNGDIDGLWRQALSENTFRLDGFAAVLPDQKGEGEDGEWLQFRPLIRCGYKNRYGHILCPVCANELCLCTDDGLLEAAGLPGYHQSLKRYLFCRQCHSDNPSFYAKTSLGEPNVRNCNELIEAFSRLLERHDLADKLPCVNCDKSGQCYGQENLAVQRLVPVSFYPFYMIHQPTATLSAADFVALLGGASIQQMEKLIISDKAPVRSERFGRIKKILEQNSPYLYAQDTSECRLFLEILFLKLCFLQEMGVLFEKHTRLATAAVDQFSLDSLWINLPETASRLPLFWNFNLSIVDVVGQPMVNQLQANLEKAQARLFWAKAWFYVLASNDRNSFRPVLDALNHLYETGQHKPFGSAQIGDAFDSAHLTWLGKAAPDDSHWDELWRRALSLGYELLRSASKVQENWDAQSFNKQLDGLIEDIRQTMFTLNASQEAPASKADAADVKIASILKDILDQWPEYPEPDQQETVIPGPDALSGPPKHDSEATQAGLPDEDGDVEETIILTDSSGKEPPPEANTILSGPGQLDKTVVTAVPKKPEMIDAGLEKTMVIKIAPDTGAGSDVEKNVSSGRKPVLPPVVELEKTVVIQAPVIAAQEQDSEKTDDAGSSSAEKASGQDAKKKMKPPPVNSQDLEATMVIDTRSLNNKGKSS